MSRSTTVLLALAGAGVGATAAGYLLLRRNREVVGRGAHRARQVSDQAERVANILDGVRKVLGPAVGEPVATAPSE